MPALFEDPKFRSRLLPFTYTRHIADIRVGIVTIKEKWEHFLGSSLNNYTSIEHFRDKYLNSPSELFINASILPSGEICKFINSTESGSAIYFEDVLVAVKLDKEEDFSKIEVDSLNKVSVKFSISAIKDRWDIFLKNESEIISDFNWITKGRKSAELSATVTVVGNREDIFLEEGVFAEGAFLNPDGGKIYIGRNASILEGSLIRGSVAICNNAVIKMGCKIYGASTFGPYSKSGGEISNSVIFGYSNKSHDGYLGNSVIGEWCNLGADSNVSNLKNNYGNIKVWDYGITDYNDSGQQFCGLSMGDHSKCGINTMFNTGTVVGVCANIFGSGFPSKFIPSFSWGGVSGFTEFRLEEAIKLAETVMNRRGIDFSETDKSILENIFNLTKPYRKY